MISGMDPALSLASNRDLLSAAIKSEAGRLGFNLVGIAPAVTPAGISDFVRWLAAGYAGEMEYLPRREAAYQHPQSVLDGVRSVIMLGLNYRNDEPAQTSPGHALVSRYAWGTLDYHDLIRGRLAALAAFVESQQPGCRTRGVVDTAPLLERDFARLAGLGWFGKNTLLLNKRMGSWFFLAALLVDVELDYDNAHATAHCGTCTRCLDACPTDAFVAPYVLDARKCISYLTIEHRGPIPLELREPMGEWVFGCDVCQDVCPWNRKAPLADEPAFKPRDDLNPLDAIELLSLDEQAFRSRFRHTPLARPKRAGLLRNAAIALGNARNPQALPALVAALNDGEPVVRGAVAWALGRLGDESARQELVARLRVEEHDEVRGELTSALDRIDRANAM